MPVAAREAEQSLPGATISHFPVRSDRRRGRRDGGRRAGSNGSEGVVMAQEIITLECTEAKALGKPASRYMSTRNKQSPRTPNRLEKKKYNPFLRRHTLHRETK